jgi:hypothetical protein
MPNPEEVHMAHQPQDHQQPPKRGPEPADAKTNKMDWPVPGSGDDPTPKPVATGLAQPIEDAAAATEARGKSDRTSPPAEGGKT